MLAGVRWPGARWGRIASAACAALAIVLGALAPLGGWREALRRDAVVMRDVRLGGSDIDLEAGRVVQILRRAAGRVVVRVGHGVDGWVPTDAVRPPESLR